MTKTEFKTMIKNYDKEGLAYWTDKETEEMGLQFRTIEKLMDEGFLIYAPNDNFYCGPNTFLKCS